TFARAYVKYNERDSLETIFGEDGGDRWDIGQGGFRVDSTLRSGDRLAFHGDFYRSNLDQQLGVPDPTVPLHVLPVEDRARAEGWNLLGRWERALSVTSSLSLQVFYDHAERDEFYVGQHHDVLDVELQQRARLGKRHDLVWGLGYRRIADDFDITRYVSFEPVSDRRDQWNAFIQDEIALQADRLRLTLGAKVEHNDYTGFEVQPNLRLLWKPGERSSLWGAVSRAVRTPARVEQTGVVWATVAPPGQRLEDRGLGSRALPLPLLVATTGDEDYRSETLTAYELGYRFSPSRQLNLDLALFYNEYDDLRTSGDDIPAAQITPEGFLFLDLPFGNRASGESYGLELAAELQINDWWRVPLTYSYLELDIENADGSFDQSNPPLARTDPRQQFSLRSLMSPREDVDVDLWLRYVDSTYPEFDVGVFGSQRIAAYWQLDLRLAWRPRPAVELSLVGQNLLEEAHQEGYQAAFGMVPVQVQRGVYGAVRLEF
ncbi:MAG: TonB-dependent receptor, partial [Thiohalocapsa sp.]|nr:TonB-dependent receptor [Thiohalocapsa sp.]MCF7993083.1 TonB-dependent receptor [Thiohalocapsa sp.]